MGRKDALPDPRLTIQQKIHATTRDSVTNPVARACGNAEMALDWRRFAIYTYVGRLAEPPTQAVQRRAVPPRGPGDQ